MLHKVYQTRDVDGMLVAALDNGGLDRILEAIHVIRIHDPVRYRRMVKDVERIWMCTVGGSVAQFQHNIWMCQLDEDFVNSELTMPELLASVIVHEATHARLRRIGFGYDETVRARVEGICLRRELAFAARIPGGIPDQWAQASLEFPLDYRDAAVGPREEENFRDQFLRIGVPGWLTSFVIVTARPLLWLRRRKRTATRPG